MYLKPFRMMCKGVAARIRAATPFPIIASILEDGSPLVVK